MSESIPRATSRIFSFTRYFDLELEIDHCNVWLKLPDGRVLHVDADIKKVEIFETEVDLEVERDSHRIWPEGNPAKKEVE